MRVEGSVFSGPGRPGDFRWMIERPEYADALFVFNDNEAQFREHQRHGAGAGLCRAGGGNAAIRPYQCAVPQRACGVPTGNVYGYERLTPEVRAVIEDAVTAVEAVTADREFARVIYSAADGSGALGTGIFSVGDDVRTYIVERLRSRLLA